MIFKVIICIFILLSIISISIADIQPIDVDPVLKKEQPDFEVSICIIVCKFINLKFFFSNSNAESSIEVVQLWLTLATFIKNDCVWLIQSSNLFFFLNVRLYFSIFNSDLTTF